MTPAVASLVRCRGSFCANLKLSVSVREWGDQWDDPELSAKGVVRPNRKNGPVFGSFCMYHPYGWNAASKQFGKLFLGFLPITRGGELKCPVSAWVLICRADHQGC